MQNVLTQYKVLLDRLIDYIILSAFILEPIGVGVN